MQEQADTKGRVKQICEHDMIPSHITRVCAKCPVLLWNLSHPFQADVQFYKKSYNDSHNVTMATASPGFTAYLIKYSLIEAIFLSELSMNLFHVLPNLHNCTAPANSEKPWKNAELANQLTARKDKQEKIAPPSLKNVDITPRDTLTFPFTGCQTVTHSENWQLILLNNSLSDYF